MRNFSNFCYHRRRRRSKLQQIRAEEMDTPIPSHEGIKRIKVVESFRQLISTSSVLRVCVVTWNMNGKISSQDLIDLVSGDHKFDLFVIGLQEVPRFNVGELLQEALVQSHSLVGKSIMQSLQLFLFAPKSHALYIKEIETDMYAIRGFGALNRRRKGAVAISISFKGIRMVFITCHLAAHARNVEERNNQLRNITSSLFSQNRNPYGRPSEITIWSGDLNYRIQGLDTHPVRDLIHNDLHRMLTCRDQLLQEAERGEIFEGYCEGNLEFKPTYKFNVGSSNYDTSHKVRVPSWTDRILFKTENFGGIDDATLHSYESIDSIRSSDHKPVKAVLSLILNDIDLPVPPRKTI